TGVQTCALPIFTRARAALAAHARLSPEDAAAGSFDADLLDESEIGHLVSRDSDISPSTSRVLPQLSAVLEISARVGTALLGPHHTTGTPTVDVTPPADAAPDAPPGGPAPGEAATTPGDHELQAGARS